jgi:hypothetical protein
MRPFIAVVGLSGMIACASSGTTSGSGSDIAQPSEHVVATDNHGSYRTTVAPNAKAVIPAAPGRVFDAMKAVYDELGVTLTTNDPSTGRLGNASFFKTRKLGTEPISTYLNCGDSFAGGVAADNYRVYMSLVSAVRPDGTGGSEIETAFSAQAQNMEGTQGDRVACGTTGRLEERIRQGVLKKVAAAGSD